MFVSEVFSELKMHDYRVLFNCTKWVCDMIQKVGYQINQTQLNLFNPVAAQPWHHVAYTKLQQVIIYSTCPISRIAFSSIPEGRPKWEKRTRLKLQLYRYPVGLVALIRNMSYFSRKDERHDLCYLWCIIVA